MRIWDLPPSQLCRQHLLGEHRELHGLWNILVKHNGRGGYSQHPETRRWVGKTKALYLRHQSLVREMSKRGYSERTPLDKSLATGSSKQDVLLNSINQQKQILKAKGCSCLLNDKDKTDR